MEILAAAWLPAAIAMVLAAAPPPASAPLPTLSRESGREVYARARVGALAAGVGALEYRLGGDFVLDGSRTVEFQDHAGLQLGLGHGLQAGIATRVTQRGLAGALRPTAQALSLRWAAPSGSAWLRPALLAELAWLHRAAPQAVLGVEIGGGGAGAVHGVLWARSRQALGGIMRPAWVAGGGGVRWHPARAGGTMALALETWCEVLQRTHARGRILVLDPRVAPSLLWHAAPGWLLQVAVPVGLHWLQEDGAALGGWVATPSLALSWGR